MKIQKGGMYGAAVVSVIVALSIFLTVALNVETETRQVTKYEYVTDTTGLFDFDDSPQYYDFDLNKNYTGYYLESTDPYWGGASFTSTAGQVITDDTDPEDYIAGGSVNNYYVNLNPIVQHTETVNLYNKNMTNKYSDLLTVFFGPEGRPLTGEYNNFPIENASEPIGNVALTDLLSELSLDGYERVIITPTYTSSASDRIIFCQMSELRDIRGDYTHAELFCTSSDHIGDYPAFTYGTINPFTYYTKIVPLSVIAYPIKGVVEFYGAADTTELLKTVNIDDVLVLFNSPDTSAVVVNPFGTNIDIVAGYIQTVYMDISKGVAVSSTGSA